MQIKKKLVKLAIVAVLLVGATAPVAAVSICDFEPTTFEMWFIHKFYC